MDRRLFLRRFSAGAIGLICVSERRGSAVAADETRLLVHSKAPLNAETQLPDLVKSWVTPVESFFIRSHGNTPEINAESYRLSVEGLVETPLTLSLAELSRF